MLRRKTKKIKDFEKISHSEMEKTDNLKAKARQKYRGQFHGGEK